MRNGIAQHFTEVEKLKIKVVEKFEIGYLDFSTEGSLEKLYTKKMPF